MVASASDLEGREGKDLLGGHEGCLEVHYSHYLDISSTHWVFNTKRPNDIVYVEHVETSIALHMYSSTLQRRTNMRTGLEDLHKRGSRQRSA